MTTAEHVVVPRPDSYPSGGVKVITAPAESAFTSVFGNLLPAASYVSTSRGRASYYILSSGTGAVGPRILLLHGVQTPAIGLLPLAQQLNTAFPTAHIALLDWPGHGLSDTPLVPHTPDLFEDLVDDILVHLGWPEAHFLGFSFGGLLTARYALSRPNRVQSAVLVAPGGLLRSKGIGWARSPPDSESQATHEIVAWLEGGELIVPADWRERVARGEVVAEAVRDWEMKVHKGHSASIVAICRDGGVMDRHADFSALSEAAIATLGIVGDSDPICSERDLKAVGMANVVVIPQANHTLCRSRAIEVAAAVQQFWRSLGMS